MTKQTVTVSALGEEREVRPRGSFARVFTKAYARLMVSSALSPLDEHLRAAQRLNPELSADDAMELANKLRSSELISNLTTETAKLLGDENLIYALAGCALGENQEWAEENLLPCEAARAVKLAMTVGGMAEYLGESLTLLAASGQSVGSAPQETPKLTPEQSGVECVR